MSIVKQQTTHASEKLERKRKRWNGVWISVSII